jgi:hypothetical protein
VGCAGAFVTRARVKLCSSRPYRHLLVRDRLAAATGARAIRTGSELAVSALPEFSRCAEWTVEHHLIFAVVIEINEVALPAARLLVSPAAALDTDKFDWHR